MEMDHFEPSIKKKMKFSANKKSPNTKKGREMNGKKFVTDDKKIIKKKKVGKITNLKFVKQGDNGKFDNSCSDTSFNQDEIVEQEEEKC